MGNGIFNHHYYKIISILLIFILVIIAAPAVKAAELCHHYTTKVPYCAGNLTTPGFSLNNPACVNSCNTLASDIGDMTIPPKPDYLTTPPGSQLVDGAWEKVTDSSSDPARRIPGYYFIPTNPPSFKMSDNRLHLNNDDYTTEAELLSKYQWVTDANPDDSPICVARCKDLLIGAEDVYNPNVGIPPQPIYPEDFDYEICYHSCIEIPACEAACISKAGMDDDKCETICSYALNQPRDTTTNDPIMNCTDLCPAEAGESNCSSYWQPKVDLTARTGLGGCGPITKKDTDKRRFTIDWSSGDYDKLYPTVKVSPPGDPSPRTYVAGLYPNDNALCVYDLGYKFLGTSDYSSIDDPEALIEGEFYMVKASDPDDAAYDAVNNTSRLCYKLPLPNGPAPCCYTLKKVAPVPEVAQLDNPLPAGVPSVHPKNGLSGYSEFRQPRIRVQYPDPFSETPLAYVDLTWVYPASGTKRITGQGDSSDGLDGCQQLDHPDPFDGWNGKRIVCPIMQNNEICAYEQLTTTEGRILGCFPRSMSMPDDPSQIGVDANNIGNDNLGNPIYSTYDSPKVRFYLADGMGSTRSIILSKNEKPCDSLFGHSFCAQARTHPVTKQRLLCVNNVHDVLGNEIVDPTYILGTDIYSDSSGSGDLCVNIPPRPCPARTRDILPSGLIHGHVAWDQGYITGDNTSQLFTPRPDQDFIDYYNAEGITPSAVKYCPPGYKESESGPPTRLCVDDGTGIGVWEDAINPCERITCPAMQISATAPAPYQTTDGAYHTSWGETNASLYLPFSIPDQPDWYDSTKVGADGIHVNYFGAASQTGTGTSKYCEHPDYGDPVVGTGMTTVRPKLGCQYDGTWQAVDKVSPPCRFLQCNGGYHSAAEANFPSPSGAGTYTAISCNLGYRTNPDNPTYPTMQCTLNADNELVYDLASITNPCVSKCQPEIFMGISWPLAFPGDEVEAACPDHLVSTLPDSDPKRICDAGGNGWMNEITGGCGCATDSDYSYNIEGFSQPITSIDWQLTATGETATSFCPSGSMVVNETITPKTGYNKVVRTPTTEVSVQRECRSDGWQAPTELCKPYARFSYYHYSYNTTGPKAGLTTHKIFDDAHVWGQVLNNAASFPSNGEGYTFFNSIQRLMVKEGQVEVCTGQNFTGNCIVINVNYDPAHNIFSSFYDLPASHYEKVQSLRSTFSGAP